LHLVFKQGDDVPGRVTRSRPHLPSSRTS
jgi:hypothetical protein